VNCQVLHLNGSGTLDYGDTEGTTVPPNIYYSTRVLLVLYFLMRNVVEFADDPLVRRLTTDLTTADVHDAVASFFSDPATAQGTYGPIASWRTASVTSFEYLFCGRGDSWCGTAYNLGA
jgi:hypothetical protein